MDSASLRAMFLDSMASNATSVHVVTTGTGEARVGVTVSACSSVCADLPTGGAASGEAGPAHSAGFCVFGREGWPVAELWVDWSDAPIADLRALWQRDEPQMNDYVMRARRPEQVPSNGVPGDL